jgi:glycogen debranching enzyme
MQKLQEITRFAEEKLGCICFVDILLNHTSFDSPWLEEEAHNNSYYNIENTPHLNSALVLDVAIQDLSEQIVMNKYPKYRKISVDNYEDLDIIMSIIRCDIIPTLKIEEYFHFDIEKVVSEFKKLFREKYPEDRILEDEGDVQADALSNAFGIDKFDLILRELESCTTGLGHFPRGVSIDFEKFSLFWKAKSSILTIRKLQEVMEYLNWQRNNMAKGFLEEALTGIRGSIEYHKVSPPS